MGQLECQFGILECWNGKNISQYPTFVVVPLPDWTSQIRIIIVNFGRLLVFSQLNILISCLQIYFRGLKYTDDKLYLWSHEVVTDHSYCHEGVVGGRALLVLTLRSVMPPPTLLYILHFPFSRFSRITKAYISNALTIIFIMKNKMKQKYFYEIGKFYLYNLKKIFDDNLVVD